MSADVGTGRYCLWGGSYQEMVYCIFLNSRFTHQGLSNKRFRSLKVTSVQIKPKFLRVIVSSWAWPVSLFQSSPKNLRCVLLNARSLRNKVLDLQALLLEDYFPMIAITETWLDSSFLDFELGLNDYCVHRKDRQDRRGGGVLLAVHTELISIRRRDLE